jgi:hypothetical protein
VAASILLVAIILAAWWLMNRRGHAHGNDRVQGTEAPAKRQVVSDPRLERRSAFQPRLMDSTELTASQVADLAGASVSPESCSEVCGAPCIHANGGLTFCGKECTSDRDCAVDALCFPTTTGIARCMLSQCSGIGHDEACPSGWTCLAVSRSSAATYICAKAGVRLAGEHCIGIGTETTAPENACAPSLLCAEGTCLPQRCRGDTDCPHGSHCQTDPGGLLPEPSCTLGCDKDADCGDGLSCINYPENRKSCVRRGNSVCLESGCPRGLVCTITMPLLPNLHAECERPCSLQHPECAANEICAASSYGGEAHATCVQTCTIGGTDCTVDKMCVPSTSGPATCRVVVTGMGKGAAAVTP